jgi:hypothetical protein
MLAPSPQFLECMKPRSVIREASACSPSEGEVWSPNPLAKDHPSSRTAIRVRSTPMWQAALIPPQG